MAFRLLKQLFGAAKSLFVQKKSVESARHAPIFGALLCFLIGVMYLCGSQNPLDMENIDIERLHADCLAWCENPTWKPWQEGWRVRRNGTWMVVADSTDTTIATFCVENQKERFSTVMFFAQAIGLSVESYRNKIGFTVLNRAFLCGENHNTGKAFSMELQEAFDVLYAYKINQIAQAGANGYKAGKTLREVIEKARIGIIERNEYGAPLDPPTADNLEGREIEPAIQKHRDAIQILFEAQQDFNGNSKGYHKLQCRIDYLEDQIEELEEQLERPKAQIVPEPTPEEVLAANGWRLDGQHGQHWKHADYPAVIVYSSNSSIAWVFSAPNHREHWNSESLSTFTQWIAENLAALSKAEEVEKPVERQLKWIHSQELDAIGWKLGSEYGPYFHDQYQGAQVEWKNGKWQIGFSCSGSVYSIWDGVESFGEWVSRGAKLIAGPQPTEEKPQPQAKEEDPEYILRENGWEWTSLKYAYEKKDSSWLIAPLPMGAWFACIHDEVTITMWILWKPNSKDSFAKYLQQF